MSKIDKLTVAITTKFSVAEAEELKARALATGVPLRAYIRRSALASMEASSDPEFVHAEHIRTRELLVRLWAAASEQDLAPDQVYQIADKVGAIDAGLLVARARRGKR